MIAKNLRDLFVEELHDIHDAEKRLIIALPKMVKAANSSELRAAFEKHLKQTEEHVTRLASVYESIDESPMAKTCKAMVGLLEEGDELMRQEGPPSVRDAALVAAAMKVEHYEMATYGCLRLWADILDEEDAEKLLRKSFDDEVSADKALMSIAKSLHEETVKSR